MRQRVERAISRLGRMVFEAERGGSVRYGVSGVSDVRRGRLAGDGMPDETRMPDGGMDGGTQGGTGHATLRWSLCLMGQDKGPKLSDTPCRGMKGDARGRGEGNVKVD